ncbi:MAG: hypothetical protein ACE5IM_09080, partial [Nitrospinota bacterium]
TSWLVRNHVGIEELGIPVVSIVQDYFLEDAQASGAAYGLPNPALAVTPEVFTTITAEQTRNAVDRIFGDILAGLTKPMPEPRGEVVRRVATRGPKDPLLEFTGSDLLDCLKKMNEGFLEWGWSDGFPLVPPTEGAVEEMLRGTARAPEDVVVEKFVPGNAWATVRDIAVNAVMAGCRPEFLPVVLTAVEAMHHPEINLRMCTVSTGAHAPLFVVNGPVAGKIGINAGSCSLGNAGPGGLSFANVAIGRAVRLALMNVGGAYPGVLDQDTIGSPAKFSMVIAENERENPWEPYHVEKGFRSEDSTVTCFYGHSLIEIADLESETADALMNTISLRVIGIGQTIFIPYSPVILLSPAHAEILSRDGWTKEDIRRYLFLHCSISAERYRRSKSLAMGPARKWIDAADSQAQIHLFQRPEVIDVVVAGGTSGKSAAYLGLFPKPYPVKG